MTQTDLAKKLGVAPTVVARLERGERADPRLSTIVRIAVVLGASLDELAAAAGLLPKPGSEGTQARLLTYNAVAASRAARKALSELDGALRAVESLDVTPAGRRRRSP